MQITVNDAGGNTVPTADAGIDLVQAVGRSVTLDDQNKNITLKTSGVTLEIKDSEINIDSQSGVNLKASGNLKIESSGNLEIKAGGQVNIKGAMVNIN